MTREEAINLLGWLKSKTNREDDLEAIDMAIEALSADAEQVTGKLKNPCDSLLTGESDERKEQNRKLESADAVTHGRLIDADALSEKLCETTIFIKDGEVFQRMINDAPTVSAEAVQGWIPCSERLPDVDVEVLTTTDWSEVLIAWHRKDGTWETDEYILDHNEITAWMPLPSPYKGGDTE